MEHLLLSKRDIRQIRSLGIPEERVISQIETFKKPLPLIRIDRPCTPSDGIKVLKEDNHPSLLRLHEEAAAQGRFLKFVPASGAASRMFKVPLWFKEQREKATREGLARMAKEGDTKASELLCLMEGIRGLAFWDDLRSAISRAGFEPDALLEKGRYHTILEFLLTPKGLNYAALPKGLLKFHSYSEGPRTAFEEHLVEAADYVRDADGICRLHFTIQMEHKEGFESLLEQVRPRYESRYRVRYHVEFSVQKSSTDTIAVDLQNRPFRLKDGSLLFRPGGHGALIENLQQLQGDLVYIKNIDNVVPDRLKGPTFLWKRLLGGYLVSLQKEIFARMERLAAETLNRDELDQILGFAKEVLFIEPPPEAGTFSSDTLRKFLISKLNRPLRVCGMVKNEGEPGGAPYWVRHKDGSRSLQILELSQIDLHSKEQRALVEASTHFNPVDLVCGLRDHQGRPFDLKRHVDEEAVFISRKSKDGRELKALELPGLWNGAMADWTTVFVEVPAITFNPVKTVNDLLRKEHLS